MTIQRYGDGWGEANVGQEIFDLMNVLYPICRSITGDGVRRTLAVVREKIPIEIHEVPSGTQVFDWTVPREWNIRDAWIRNPQGQKIIDFQQSNLHIVNYSVPVHSRIPLAELKSHLHTLPDQLDHIPYRTTYYRESWGFCLTHRQYLELAEGLYEVFIDATLQEGFLTYGECRIPGETSEEILLSTHICHPSLANDNLSGIGLTTCLAKRLLQRRHRYSYRILFIPGTIGALTWLQQNFADLKPIRHGLVVSGVGDPGSLTYKKSRRGNAEIDRVAQYVFGKRGSGANIQEFTPYGYDERQFCSPGFNLPIGRLSRTPYGEYPQYHNSGDNLDFVGADYLADSFSALTEIIDLLEDNRRFINLKPYGEPQLGKRGLYEQIGSRQLAMLWVLNLSDGEHSLLDIAERSGIDFQAIREAALVLKNASLLE